MLPTNTLDWEANSRIYRRPFLVHHQGLYQ